MGIDTDGIKCAACNQDREPHRIERLNRVIGFVLAKSHTTIDKISGLYDHKGDLTVYWNSAPRSSEKDLLEEAWEAMLEMQENVSHRASRKRRKLTGAAIENFETIEDYGYEDAFGEDYESDRSWGGASPEDDFDDVDVTAEYGIDVPNVKKSTAKKRVKRK